MASILSVCCPVTVLAIESVPSQNKKGNFVSLFEDSNYQYRDTYFVFFKKENRPSLDKIESTLAELGTRYQTLKSSEQDGEFESLTFVSPYDYSAMDIAVAGGEEVQTQIEELMEEFKTMTLTGDDSKKLTTLGHCDSRFDIFHFENIEGAGEDEFLDPGGLLLVMEKLSELSDGVALDPQSHSLF